jgi:hypothetical protein
MRFDTDATDIPVGSKGMKITAAEKAKAERLYDDFEKIYHVQMKPLAGLHVDNNYHDDEDPKRVAYIVANFQIPAVNPIIVSVRANGDRYIVNGRHTHKGLLGVGYLKGPQIELKGLNVREEASLMLAIQDRKSHKTLTPKASFNAEVKSGKGISPALNVIFIRQGFAVNRTQGKFPVQGLGAYKTAYRLDEGKSLELAMCRAKNAWPRVPIPGNHILALSALIHVCGSGNYDADKLTETLRGGKSGTLIPNDWTQSVISDKRFGKISKRFVPYGLAVVIAEECSKSGRSKRIDGTWVLEGLDKLLPNPSPVKKPMLRLVKKAA